MSPLVKLSEACLNECLPVGSLTGSLFNSSEALTVLSHRLDAAKQAISSAIVKKNVIIGF